MTPKNEREPYGGDPLPSMAMEETAEPECSHEPKMTAAEWANECVAISRDFKTVSVVYGKCLHNIATFDDAEKAKACSSQIVALLTEMLEKFTAYQKAEPSSPSVGAQEPGDETKWSRADLEKYYRWQADSLKAFRDKFSVPSNCQALDAIDELKAKLAASG